MRSCIFPGILLLWLAFLAGRADANSYAFDLLEKVPNAEEVFAFASTPPARTPEQKPPFPPSRQLSQEDILLFLSKGVRQKVDFAPKGDGVSWCTGVFFTKAGDAYFWKLWNPQTLEVSAAKDHRTCYVVLEGSSSVQSRVAPRGWDEVHHLQPPKADEFLWFTNGDLPGDGLWLELEKPRIVEFLARGEVIHYETTLEEWKLRDEAIFTLPPETQKRMADYNERYASGKVSLSTESIQICGSFVTRSGKVFFWELWGDKLLHLSDTTAAECAIRLR